MPRLLRGVKMLHMWIQITKGYSRFKVVFVDRTMDGALPHQVAVVKMVKSILVFTAFSGVKEKD